MVERYVRDVEAAGSNPVTPITGKTQFLPMKTTYIKNALKDRKQRCSFRSVTQLGRALRSGRRGRRFKSCHSDFFIRYRKALISGFYGVFIFFENITEFLKRFCQYLSNEVIFKKNDPVGKGCIRSVLVALA